MEKIRQAKPCARSLLALSVGVIATTALWGCTTTFGDSKVDYKSQAVTTPDLTVPPDLTQISRSSSANVPQSGAINASALDQPASSRTALSPSLVVAPDQVGDVRVMREGPNRWLKVARSPEALWPELHKFWVDSGFTLLLDDPKLGIIETDWAENRAKLPKDWLHRAFPSFNKLSDTHERDRFRMRLERAKDGGTEVFVTHKGLVEDLVAGARDTALRWQARPTDPELEQEFLRRIMGALTGATTAQTEQALPQEQAAEAKKDAAATKTSGTTASVPARVHLVLSAANATSAASQSLVLDEPFDPAWRRVGLSLDRNNFTVEDRDRSQGVYFVRYAMPIAEKDQPGFFARMFGAKPKTRPLQYRLLLRAENGKTRLQITDAAGSVVANDESLMMLKVLEADLK